MPRLRSYVLILTLVLAPGLFSSLWDWLTGAWAEAGCIIDPDGRCVPAPSADEGCGIDPDGRTCTGGQ